GMNSLNHYTYGSIVQWMYEHICGLRLTSPGFRTFTVRPAFTHRFTEVSMSYDSAVGKIAAGWRRDEGGYTVTVTVPFDTTATLELPGRGPLPLTPGTHTVRV
ncbi:MAG: alpha-L-rhamnosidase, partial [Clostridia bacterium]|nr:alpha-L-rhamnosidase [Clostridia bacterium]